MKKLLNSFLVLAIISLIVSCNGYLEKTPRAALTPDKALADSNGIQSTLFSAYRRLHQFDYYGREMMLLGDVLADNAIIAINTGRYTAAINNQIFVHFAFWSGAPYAAINEANFVLEEVVKPEIRMSDNLRKRLRAEALFIRALCHHDLLRVYSYEPANAAGFNLGVVLRKKPTRGASDADGAVRATVAESYDFVIADLLEAIDLFSSIPNVGFPTRANKAAAEALLARVYLYAGRFAEAADMAETALNTVDNQAAPKATLTTPANHVSSFAMANHPESVFEIDISAADWSTVDGVNNSLSSWTRGPASNVALPGPGPVFAIAGAPNLIAAFPMGDVRGNPSTGLWRTYSSGSLRECVKWRGDKGNFVENVPVIRYAELVLIQAEGRARSGGEAAALTALNRLRTNRGLAAVSLSGAQLIDEIMLQRRLEFAFEGHRWFDLKRLGMTIPKEPTLGVPALSPSDTRLLSFIPTTEISINPKLVQNPGY
ncbi:MAG: RagB/SusD family nutrient uptake outer membrane protein [Raineya sp.]